MIVITEATCPSEFKHDECYVWLIDLGDSSDMKHARQEMKGRLLALLPDEHEVSTSFSYTSHYMAMAVSFSGLVGVDIEDMRRQFDFADVAENFFTGQELQKLNSLENFYQVWTAKESLIKAVGFGFAMDTQTFSLKRNADLIALESIEGYAKENFKFDTITKSPVQLSLCCHTTVTQ